MRLRKGEIFIKAENFPDDVLTCFSTRLGGTGSGEYEGMNPDPRRPWPFEIVKKNAETLGMAAGFKAENMYMINQVHGDTIKCVSGGEAGAGISRPIEVFADALITDVPGIALTIFTADCTPVLIYDPVKKVVAAVHAGWKGTALDIAGKTVEKMKREYGCLPKDMHAAIGPCISRCCFETHSDVPDAMITLLGDAALSAIDKKYSDEEGEEKFFVDLKLINSMLLERSGVKKENIEISPHCTACETETFWSHRRMGTARGSLAAVIMLK
ncbi:MAG: peptidoglycan editing factor PgeF [Firmicutes bacterium]|nr:peptidoglycan editing factor PgeF [Bacillota bacterium]MBQ9972198.1 peptidoglycan editing factor PgeF [Bacillota bacterium]